jgi:outer membrane immunogenic protein
MRTKLAFAIVAVMGLGGVQVATAADMPVKARAPVAVAAPAWNWTGCYVGINGGGAWGRSDHLDVTGPSFTNTFNVQGGLVGGTVGCNYQFAPQWLVGVEGDWDWSGKKGSSFDVGPFGNPAFTSSTNEKWIATVRGRVGFLPMSNLVLFATGGWADASVEGVVNIPGAGTFSQTNNRSGWTAGGGFEWAIWPSTPVAHNWVSVKAEYLYVKFNNSAYTFVPPVVPRGNIALNDNILRVGLNWHF